MISLPPHDISTDASRTRTPPWLRVLAVVLAVHLVVLLLWTVRRTHPQAPASVPVETRPDITKPVRAAPPRFPANTSLPAQREMDVSGALRLSSFSAGRDLVYVDDARVWWESDDDGETDHECDHTVHRALETPLRRLIELVSARGARLKVQDTYRPTGIHNSRSLHQEGRAIDVTCDEIKMEELAKLCWQAGFDWVLHEGPSRNGAHVHASVRRLSAGQTASTTGTVSVAQAAAAKKP
ncbi:MAG: hypothetical protein PHR35_07825 [Kiritimatiellae bacterium]|nr:hypothetical protein [Kiritimatiellia bacterium]